MFSNLKTLARNVFSQSDGRLLCDPDEGLTDLAVDCVLADN